VKHCRRFDYSTKCLHTYRTNRIVVTKRLTGNEGLTLDEGAYINFARILQAYKHNHQLKQQKQRNVASAATALAGAVDTGAGVGRMRLHGVHRGERWTDGLAEAASGSIDRSAVSTDGVRGSARPGIATLSDRPTGTKCIYSGHQQHQRLSSRLILAYSICKHNSIDLNNSE